MSETPAPHTSSDGLGRWLIGGLAAGAVVLGLLIAAYAIGYHRGKDTTRGPAAAAAAAPAPTTAAAPKPKPKPKATPALGPVAVTPGLVARGKTLYQTDGCSSCHALSTAAGAGPGFKGLAGSTVTLATGQAVTADDAYLARSIVDPDAEVVKGFPAGIMGPAIGSHDLAHDPAAVRALVAFVKAQK